MTRTYAGPGDTVPTRPVTGGNPKPPKNWKRWLYRAVVAGVTAGVAWALKGWLA